MEIKGVQFVSEPEISVGVVVQADKALEEIPSYC